MKAVRTNCSTKNTDLLTAARVSDLRRPGSLEDRMMDNALYHENLQEFHKWLSSSETNLQVQAENPDEFFANNQAMLSVIDTLPNGFTILTPDFKVLYTNKAMQRWFASGRKSYHIKCYRLFHNNQKTPCTQGPAMTSIQTKGPASIIHDCGTDEETGEPFYMHIHTVPVLNAAGDAVLILEYSYNLTEQKRMAETLENANRKILLLEQENSLLKKSLEENEQHLRDLEDTVRNNMETYVRPAVEYIQGKIGQDGRILSSMIEESVYPITRQRHSRAINLTTREIQVATMIKEGQSSKQIADTLCITKKAVDYHRANIRKKLKLDQKTNLQVYLSVYL